MIEIEKIFSEALLNVISTTSGIDLEKDDNINFSTEFKCNNIMALMMLSGMKNGLLIIDSNRSSIEILTSYITGTDICDIEEKELYDSIAEIANMIAGSAKLKVKDSEYEYSLTSPFTMTSEKVNIIMKRSISGIAVGFKSADICIALRVIYL